MKIYEIIKGIVEELEKDKIMVIEAEKNILADEDLTIKKKNEMLREMHQKYFEKIEKANNNGVEILAISKRLGHTNPTMTLNIYSHLYKSTELRA